MRKTGEAKKKVATYNYTQAQFDMAVKAGVNELKKDLIHQIVTKNVNSYIIITAYTLHFMFGFGSTRLKRFFYKFYQNCDDVAFDGVENDADPVSIEDLAKELIEDGIDVQQILSNKITEHETRDRRQMEKDMPEVKPIPKRKNNRKTLFLARR